MSSNNIFYNIYNKKSDDELKTIATGDSYTDDSRLCAISILRERNIPIEDLISKENELIEKRDKRLGSEISSSRYHTGFERFVALIIDGIVVSLISWLFKFLYGVESRFVIAFLNILQLALPYLYNIILHGSSGQTIGKMVMDVKIYDKSETKVISYKQAIIRDIIPLTLLLIVQVISYFINIYDLGLLMYISLAMTFFLLFWSILEIITMLFNNKRRALHDFIAGTVVLKVHG